MYIYVTMMECGEYSDWFTRIESIHFDLNKAVYELNHKPVELVGDVRFNDFAYYYINAWEKYTQSIFTIRHPDHEIGKWFTYNEIKDIVWTSKYDHDKTIWYIERHETQDLPMNIAFLCNGKAPCYGLDNCGLFINDFNNACHHTLNPKYAKNFENLGDEQYIEVEHNDRTNL